MKIWLDVTLSMLKEEVEDGYDAVDSKLESVCNKLFDIACEVNDELHYQYHSSMEEQYQSAFSSELKQKKFVYHRETVIELHYKGFPVKETEADYVLLPGGPNKFDHNIVIEVKHPASQGLAKNRLQLFTYLHSGPTNNNPLTGNLRYGILLIWPTQSNPKISDDGRFADLAKPVPGPLMELWKSTNSTSRNRFQLLKTWGS